MERKPKIDNKKRKRSIIIATVILALTIGLVIYKKVKDYHKKWSSVEQTFMADFVGGEEKELLIVHDYYKNEAAMQLVDINSGKSIWKSSCRPSHVHESKRIVVTDSILAIAYDDYVNTKDYNDALLGVEGFDKSTGKKIWEYKVKPDRFMGLYFWLKGFKNNIFLLTTNHENNFITSISQQSGKKNWEATLPNEFLYAPVFLDGKKIVFNLHSLIYFVDIQTGNLEIIGKEGDRFRDIYKLEGKLAYLKNDTLFSHHSQGFYNMETDSAISLHIKELSYGQSALSVTQLVSLATNQKGNGVIESISSSSEKLNYTFSLNDSLTIENWFYLDVENREPEHSGFHVLKTRYLPFIVEKDIDDYRSTKKIMVFDLESGKPAWQSKPFITGDIDLLAKDILFHKGHFIITFNFRGWKSHESVIKQPTFLCLDGKTGRFVKSASLSLGELAAINYQWLGYSMFAGNYFYGFTPHVAWCLNYPDLTLAYASNKALKVKDARASLEKVFGTMPWR